MADGGYNKKELISLQADMEEFIMRYITLDGRYASIFSHYFTILNHFRHGRLISIPFYLVSSLENSLVKHSENQDNLVIHEGLILLIMEYAQAHEVKPSPKDKTHISSSNPDVQLVSDTKMDEDDSGMTMDWRDIKDMEDPEYKPKIEGEFMVNPRTHRSRKTNPPMWAASKFKSNSRKIQDLEPPTKKKSKLAKSGGSKALDHEIKLDIPIKVDDEKQGSVIKEYKGEIKEERVMGNLILEATRSQEQCWKWVEKEIGSLKDGIK